MPSKGAGWGLSETFAAPLPLPLLGIGQKQHQSKVKQISPGPNKRVAHGSRAGMTLEQLPVLCLNNSHSGAAAGSDSAGHRATAGR